jgi:glycosyltransferase involved in cell wall biosynthesis
MVTREIPSIAVILLSFNRPAMLDQSYDSILAAGLTERDAIVLFDDGSDVFNAFEWAAAHPAVKAAFIEPHKTLDYRMVTPVLGRMVNTATEAAIEQGHQIIAVLCDDDLYAPGWLTEVRAVLAEPEPYHVVRGVWRCFDDPLTDGPMAWPTRSYLFKSDFRRMTTGNFAYRVECVTQHGLQWSPETVAVHDDTFLWNLHAIHDLKPRNQPAGVKDSKALAGYRRVHEWNMANYTANSLYAVGAEEALARGKLE